MIFSLEMHYVLKEGNAEMPKLGIFQKMGKSKFWQNPNFGFFCNYMGYDIIF